MKVSRNKSNQTVFLEIKKYTQWNLKLDKGIKQTRYSQRKNSKFEDTIEEITQSQHREILRWKIYFKNWDKLETKVCEKCPIESQKIDSKEMGT